MVRLRDLEPLVQHWLGVARLARVIDLAVSVPLRPAFFF